MGDHDHNMGSLAAIPRIGSQAGDTRQAFSRRGILAGVSGLAVVAATGTDAFGAAVDTMRAVGKAVLEGSAAESADPVIDLCQSWHRLHSEMNAAYDRAGNHLDELRAAGVSSEAIDDDPISHDLWQESYRLDEEVEQLGRRIAATPATTFAGVLEKFEVGAIWANDVLKAGDPYCFPLISAMNDLRRLTTQRPTAIAAA